MAKDIEITQQQYQDLIARVDKEVPSPNVRAHRVLAYLRRSEFTNWDVVCFCAEYLGLTSISLTGIQPTAKEMLRLIYLTHYMREADQQWLDKLKISDGQEESSMG